MSDYRESEDPEAMIAECEHCHAPVGHECLDTCPTMTDQEIKLKRIVFVTYAREEDAEDVIEELSMNFMNSEFSQWIPYRPRIEAGPAEELKTALTHHPDVR